VKSTINLLPEASQKRLEHARQSRSWLVVWLAFAVVLAAVHFAIDASRRRAADDLSVAEESVAPLRLAEDEVERTRASTAAIRRRKDDHASIEGADVPLAIVQAIGDCCHEIGCQIELGSLRVDEMAAESGGPATGGSATGGPAGGGANRPPPAPRKQVLLAGIADDDACVSALVAQLHGSGLFQRVEIEASQAQSDQAHSRRAFQIRCQQ
jgi:Tfp pilus assembly protein PilN